LFGFPFIFPHTIFISAHGAVQLPAYYTGPLVANDMICDAGRRDRFIYVLQEWIISRRVPASYSAADDIIRNRISPTRGFHILIASLTARNDKRIF
jgi:hypothetical protein